MTPAAAPIPNLSETIRVNRGPLANFMLLGANPLYDRIVLGRVHPVSLWGGLFLVAFANFLPWSFAESGLATNRPVAGELSREACLSMRGTQVS